MATLPGTQPIYEADRGWRQWHIDEIYTGPEGKGRMVPNINDLVFLQAQRRYQIVVDLDKSSYLSRLADYDFKDPEDGLSTGDILLGIGPGYTSESFRAYIDTSVTPHTLTLDDVMHAYGSAVSHYKVFLGTAIGASGIVVSAYYNQNNEFVSENIPMELAANVTGNHAVKAFKPGFTSRALADGEVLTVVTYNDLGEVCGYAKVLVKNTRYVRASSASQKHITGIGLRSPFLSNTEDNTLVVPINVPVSSVAVMGIVKYSDGSSKEVPIDGNKMSLLGLDAYVATILGQRLPLVLTYKLSNAEATQLSANGVVAHISESFWARTEETNGSYTVKLFVSPYWVDEFTGWKLDYFLYDLDRGEYYYATPYVEGAANSRPFEPLLYNTTQRLTVSVDLNRVDSRLVPYRHAQTFDIALMGNGLDNRTPWLINYDPGQEPTYGTNLKAELVFNQVNDWTANIACGATTLVEWLDRTYYATQPLFDPRTETRAPAPTHFILEINGLRNEYQLSDWNTALPSDTGGLVGRAAHIEWVRKVAGVTQRLGHSPLVIVHTN